MKKIIIISVLLLIFAGTFARCGRHTATVRVDSAPSGATVSVNGEEKGTTPLVLTLPYGRYKISAEKEGYGSKHTEVVVDKPNVVVNINIGQTAAKKFNITISDSPHTPYNPQHYTVYLDGHFSGVTTPCTLSGISEGTHTIKLVAVNKQLVKTVNLSKDESFNAMAFDEVKTPDRCTVDVKDYSGRKKFPSRWIVFDDGKPYVPHSLSMVGRGYSDVFVGETVRLNGFVAKGLHAKEVEITFPSEKKVIIPLKNENGKEVFSKTVTFNELGYYSIRCGKNSSAFRVLYRATPLPPLKTVRDLFNYTKGIQENSAITFPYDKDQTIRLFITDANGNPIVNKPIGMYDAKTDGRGIVTLQLKYKNGKETINGKRVDWWWLYGYLLYFPYIETDISVKDTDVKYINGDIYIPKTQVLGYFSNDDIRDVKVINGKTYADLDTLRSGTGVSVIVTDKKIKFMKVWFLAP